MVSVGVRLCFLQTMCFCWPALSRLVFLLISDRLDREFGAVSADGPGEEGAELDGQTDLIYL